MALTTKDGLLYRDGEMIPVGQADQFAHMYGFAYAEQLVRHLEAQQTPPPEGWIEPKNDHE